MKNQKYWPLLLIVAAFIVIFRRMSKTVVDQAAEFIQPLEGFRPVAYWDYKAYSIGYGSQTVDGKQVLQGQTITKEKAIIELKKRLQSDLDKIKATVKIPLKDCQYVALLSFAYNVGPVAFGSTLIKSIAQGSPRQSIEAEFRKWKYAGGQVNQVLVNRRETEIKKFYS